jgi:hypothetical protein
MITYEDDPPRIRTCLAGLKINIFKDRLFAEMEMLIFH